MRTSVRGATAVLFLLAGCSAVDPTDPGSAKSGGSAGHVTTLLELRDQCPITGEAGRLEFAPILLAALVPLAADFAKEVATRAFKAYGDYLSSLDNRLDATTTYQNGGDLYAKHTDSQGKEYADLGVGCIVLVRGDLGKPTADNASANNDTIWSAKHLEDLGLRRPPELYAEIIVEPFASNVTDKRLEPPITRLRLVGYDYRQSAAEVQSAEKNVSISVSLIRPGDKEPLLFDTLDLGRVRLNSREFEPSALRGVASKYWPLPKPAFSEKAGHGELQPFPVNVIVSVTESDKPPPWTQVAGGAFTATSGDAGDAAKTLVETLVKSLTGDESEKKAAK